MNIENNHTVFYFFNICYYPHFAKKKKRVYSGNCSETNVKKVREPYKSHCCRIFYTLPGNMVLLFEMHRFCRKSVLSWVLMRNPSRRCTILFNMCKKELLETKMLISFLSLLCKESGLFQQHLFCLKRA